MCVRVLGRPWQWWVTAPLQTAHYVGVWNMARLSRRPLHDLSRYLFKSGSYPYVCRLRTPIGDVTINLGSWHDMLTTNEVFCRLDYKSGDDVANVVDIGANIGVSALYFLTRNPTVRCHLAEPNPQNVECLRRNLAPFSDRYTLTECAVADRAGTVEFGIESTGRYGGIGLDLEEAITVECLEINDFLEEVIEKSSRIDVLKIDTEGYEARTVRAMRPEIIEQVDVIYLESLKPVEPLHPDSMRQTRRLATVRLAHQPAAT